MEAVLAYRCLSKAGLWFEEINWSCLKGVCRQIAFVVLASARLKTSKSMLCFYFLCSMIMYAKTVFPQVYDSNLWSIYITDHNRKKNPPRKHQYRDSHRELLLSNIKELAT